MKHPATAHRARALACAALSVTLPALASAADRTVKVRGSGIDLVNTAIVHSKTPTPSGSITQSTETVELAGDLHGRVLYQITTVVDSAHGTLVNTGHQVFSGTVAGSQPVMLHDSKFRFEVNLVTGAGRGSVYLADHIAGPQVNCTLQVADTGKNPEGNQTFKYTGECVFHDAG
ncbi:MAG TPA: hypothetical protein VGI91_11510 [Steroidobacteraceae bacterium]|jgi:hypothetical protein